jgi:hypothetical protein
MQELKAMWPHHKTVITMRTHEVTWPHHMPIFLNKVQGVLKNKKKSELFSVLHAPIYKITSSSIFKIFENASGGDVTNELTLEKKHRR